MEVFRRLHDTCVASFLACALIGCTSNPARPISMSLTDLGTEEQLDYGGGDNKTPLRHRRSYNITGLGAADTIGLMTLEHDASHTGQNKRSSRLPDGLALRVSSECSVVAETSYANKAVSGNDISTVKQALQGINDAQAQLAVLEMRSVLLNELKEVLESEQSLTTQVAQAKASGDEGALKTLNAQLATQKTYARQLAAALVTNPNEVAIATMDEWKKQTNVVSARIASLRETLQRNNQEATKALSMPGILVTRWTVGEESNFATELAGNAFQSSKQKQAERHGFLILGNPRTYTLIVGDDFVRRACKTSALRATGLNNCHEFFKVNEEKPYPTGTMLSNTRTGVDSAFSPDRLQVTTFQLMAEHWAWVEDNSRESMIRLAAQIDALALAAQPLTQGKLLERLQQLKLSLSYTSNFNQHAHIGGIFSKPETTLIPVDYGTDATMHASLFRMMNRQSGTGRIISMRSTVDSHFLNGQKVYMPASDACRNDKSTPAELSRAKLASAESLASAINQCDKSKDEAACKVAVKNHAIATISAIKIEVNKDRTQTGSATPAKLSTP